MKQSEKDALQEKIDELQQRLDEQVDEEESGPVLGDVYESYPGSSIVMLTSLRSYVDKETAVSLKSGQGPDLGVGNSSNKFWHEGYKRYRLGTFDEVFVRRDKIREELKGKFMKMEDPASISGHGAWTFQVSPVDKHHFIDNLFDGKNCDGSEVA